MEKGMNRTWLFILMLAVIAVVIAVWVFFGNTAGSYSGGLLIELPTQEVECVSTVVGARL